jgi:hypothetical protein
MRTRPGRLAGGLVAWSRGEEDAEAQAAAVRVASVLLLIEHALTRRR